MTIKTLTNAVDLAALQADWDRLHANAGGSVFQTYDWNITWWRLFGKGLELRIITQWDGVNLSV